MEYSYAEGLKCSRLMCGTVQFGLDYGIANRSGRVSRGDARDMVDFAFRAGINAFDTAPNYGDSERVLGKIFAELGIKNRGLFLSDKIPPVPEGFSARQAEKFIRNSVEDSLRKLGVDYIAVCLFHREKDLVFMDELAKLKDRELIRGAGASVYNTEAALDFISKGEGGALQVPASLLDMRFLRAGVLDRAVKKGVSVFARSIYLQGLLLMEKEKIPEGLRPASPVIEELDAVSGGRGMCLRECALRYALSLPGISSIVVGADNIGQLAENIEFANKGPVDEECAAEIQGRVPDLPEDILVPSRWKELPG